MSNNIPTLGIDGVHKTYMNGPEKLKVLRGIDIELHRGSSLVIQGESGCGKTTLLNLIGGLDRPDQGLIRIAGLEISHLSEESLTIIRRDSIGFVFQFHYLLRDFSALENVMLPCYMSGKTKREATSRARELLSQVNLAQRMDHYPHQLSGGERQRVAIGRALINDPVLLLADEPTGNLDERHSAIVEDLIFRLAEDYNKTLIIATHDRRLAERGEKHFTLTKGVLTST